MGAGGYSKKPVILRFWPFFSEAFFKGLFWINIFYIILFHYFFNKNNKKYNKIKGLGDLTLELKNHLALMQMKKWPFSIIVCRLIVKSSKFPVLFYAPALSVDSWKSCILPVCNTGPVSLDNGFSSLHFWHRFSILLSHFVLPAHWASLLYWTGVTKP